jgi:signal transduction histidine kinase
MHTLTLRIYLTVVAVLLLFAFGSGWLFQREVEEERLRAEALVADRMAGWGNLINHSLPGTQAAAEVQSAALLAWSHRLRLPMALDGTRGERIATSESFRRRQAEDGVRALAIQLDDGRVLWIMRPSQRSPDKGLVDEPDGWFLVGQGLGWPRGVGLAVVLMLLFVAVAAGAWPAVSRLTRRLKALQAGVEQFGAGQLNHRVDVSGQDEVAALALSFNQAACRIEALVRSHQSLLANASHELRSPLARLRMSVSMLGDAPGPEQHERLRREIDTNVGELDALVEEVLLASRLDAAPDERPREPVDLLALAAEEGARVEAAIGGTPVSVAGDERLLRRALRNLLENARRYGGSEVSVQVRPEGDDRAVVQVCDRGPGVPEALRERIFEAFYRLPGHAEQAGGVGLGLSLVKQIAERHAGRVRCIEREGGGSCFELSLPTG